MVAGHARVCVGCDHFDRLDVVLSEEEVTEEGDSDAVPFDDRRPTGFPQIASGAEVRIYAR